MRCQSCVFWHPNTLRHLSFIGECRVKPPKINKQKLKTHHMETAIFPVTDRDCFCGGYKKEGINE